MKTRQELLEYAQSVHRAINGVEIPISVDTSDHPYGGYDLSVIEELVDSTLVKKQKRSFEKQIQSEVETLYATLEIDTPVKVTKGSKDKRGMEGFIIHAQDPLMGSGQLLFVYDVLTNKNCMVRSSATKSRTPKYGEREVLKETYQVCKDRARSFTRGVQVELKADTKYKGCCLKDAQLDPNCEGNGFYQVEVQWAESPVTLTRRATYILTELNIIS
jgi:hypothetical protein